MPDVQHDGGGIEEGTGGIDGGFDIFGEASIPVDPSKEAFDGPYSWEHDEADLIGDPFSDGLLEFETDSGGELGGTGKTLAS